LIGFERLRRSEQASLEMNFRPRAKSAIFARYTKGE